MYSSLALQVVLQVVIADLAFAAKIHISEAPAAIAKLKEAGANYSVLHLEGWNTEQFNLTQPVREAVYHLFNDGHKISAIKLLRNVMDSDGFGLKEAKELAEFIAVTGPYC